MNLIINNQEGSQTNSSIHNINTMNKHHVLDPKPTYHVLKREHSMLHKKFQQFTTQWDNLKNIKAKFKAALRKFLHTHSFYSVDKFSFMSKGHL